MPKIQLLGIPFDYGQPKKGVRKAFRKLAERGLLNLLEKFSCVEVSEIKFADRGEDSIQQNIRHASEASIASQLISRKIETLPLQNDFLVNIGGDHGMALGTIHGILAHHPNSVIVWADAHGDMNSPETSPSGNFHGMPLAFLLNQARHEEFTWIKRFIRPEKLILLGPRDLDEGERELIRELKIQYYSSEDINLLGMDEILNLALHRADPHESSPIHLSFDVDMCDASDFFATGTRVAHGPQLEDIFLMASLLAQTGRLRSVDVVEFNPELGDEESIGKSAQLVMQFMRTILEQVFTERSYSTTLDQNDIYCPMGVWRQNEGSKESGNSLSH
jgi:arginase